jgi:dipeptidyl aminopeptidase/acylaminoacyl peptidase
MISAAMVAAGRELSEPRLRPGGGLVAFVATTGGRALLVTMALDGGPEIVITTTPAPRGGRALGGGGFAWVPDGSALVYAAVDGNLWLQPAAGGPPRRLTEQPPGRPAQAPAASPDGTRVAYVVDEREIAVVGLAPGAPWPVRLSGTADFAFDPCFSADGAFVAWHEWSVPAMAWDESRWVLSPAEGGGPTLAVGAEGVAVQQPRFAPVGADLAYLSDASGWMNLWLLGADHDHDAPFVSEPFEHGGPTWGFGQRSFAWSPDGVAIAFTRNEDGFGRLCVVAVRGDDAGVVREIARGVHGGLDWQGSTLVAVRTGGVTPTQIVAYDAGVHGEGSWTRRVLARGPVAGFEADLVEPEAVTWIADDGATVHGRLYRPTVATTGAGSRPPLVLWVHGGPTDQWMVTFRARLAYQVARGWAVLVPDHRGSSGHGREYQQALQGRWGELDVNDCAAGVRAAANEGWADENRVVAMGGSAGGFTVLNLLAHHGELFAAGVALYPVCDLLTLAEGTHRFEAHYDQGLVGPLPASAAAFRERSPLTVAESITAPLLVLHGSTDPVVPVGQSQQLVARLQALGRPAELHVYDGEGHGWGRAEVVLDEIARVDAFLDRHALRWRP